MGPLGLAENSSKASETLGVGGYGNLGAPSLAALPAAAAVLKVDENRKVSSTIRSSTSDHLKSDQASTKSRRKRIRHGEESEVLEVAERSRLVPGEQKQMRRKSRASVEDRRSTVSRKPRGKMAERMVSEDQKLATAKGPAETEVQHDIETRRKQGSRRPESLASLAASAAAVAAVGSGLTADQLRCVTVRIGGIEVQVPMLARGAKAQVRIAKSVAELEADMHKSIFSFGKLPSCQIIPSCAT